MDLDSLVVEMMELAKSQHTQLIRTVSHNTNMVVRLTKDAGLANKELVNSVNALGNKTDLDLKEIQNEIKQMTFTKDCNKTDKIEVEVIEEVTTLQTPVIHNITEIAVIALNTTPVINTTSKHYDSDVLRITADEEGVLADNSSVIERTEILKTPVKPTVLQIIGMLSPNMTQDQVQSLFYHLNSTVNFENLEAIIQNTEADSSDEEETYSDETFDPENLNSTTKSDLYSDSNNITTSQLQSLNDTISGVESSKVTTNYTCSYVENAAENINNLSTTEKNLPSKDGDSSEADLLYEEMDEDTVQDELSDIDIDTTTKSANPLTTAAISLNQTEAESVPKGLKEHIKMFALLIKIKNSNITLDDSWATAKVGENNTLYTLIPTLCKLCLAEENIGHLRVEDLKQILENRLQAIRQTINDELWYEKIQDVCSRLVEFYQRKTTTVTSPSTN